jgi:hypothetical protein
MRSGPPSLLAWGLCGLAILMMGAGVVLEEASNAPSDGSLLEDILLWLAFVSFPVLGALVASRQPRNAIGWIFIAIGVGIGLLVAGTEYAYYGLVLDNEVPGAAVGAWLEQWLWLPSTGLMLTFGLLLFPDGRLPSRRWRWVAWVTGSLIALVTIGGMLEERLRGGHPPRDGYSVDNPIGIPGLGDVEETWGPVLLLFLGCMLLCMLSIVIRFRRSGGDERQQLKLVTFAACFMVVMLIVSDLLDAFVGDGFGWLFPVVLLVFLASIAVAMLKYRLYDIDLVINRTLVYGALTALLAATYLGLVVVLQGVIPAAGDSDLTIAGSTLAVAALFRPLRSRVQGFIDRRFYRRKFDAQRTLESFSVSLREDVDLDHLSADLLNVVRETMQPVHASLWLRRSELSP